MVDRDSTPALKSSNPFFVSKLMRLSPTERLGVNARSDAVAGSTAGSVWFILCCKDVDCCYQVINQIGKLAELVGEFLVNRRIS